VPGSYGARVDARYRRWDGTQDPFDDPVDTAGILEELSHEILHGFGARDALDRLLRDGFGDRVGLDDIRRRVRAQRELAERRAAGSPFDAVADELQQVVDLERAELRGRDDVDAVFAELALDTLPDDPAGRFRALRQHPFASQEARRRFEELQDRLRREVLDATVGQLAAGIRDATPEDLARTREMLAALHELVAARDRGEEPDIAGFLDRFGDMFSSDPDTLDDVLAELAERMAAMSRLMASMTPQQRAALQELMDDVLSDLDMQAEMAQLSDLLRELAPHLPWDRADLRPDGDGGPLSEMLDAATRLGQLDELEEQLAGGYRGATLDDVDEEALRANLGDDALRDLRRLKAIERELGSSGALQRRDGELVLSPRGARMLGERALVSLLDRVRREPSTSSVGADPEPTGQTRPWTFGDREPISVTRTVHNAVLRRAAAGARPGDPVRLHPDDVEVVEHEVRPRTATALLLDLSFSMPLQGHIVPAKRMALALQALIAGKHRQDSLHLIGFSDYARRMQPADLGAPGFERVYGTNMQHAFLLARRVLADDPRPVKQVIMVTDGEPTAHLEGDQAVFNWPPVPETLERTLREAMRLARSGIRLNIFLLEDAHGLVSFAERLAQLTDGQVFHLCGDDLGRHIVQGYDTAAAG
jgi:uncharacterized protein with von Willebrand factor type A (vWA) domain